MTQELQHPWGMVTLPDGSMLITERQGRLRRWVNGKLQVNPIKGLPEIAVVGQGGLLDIALHPDYSNNGWIYFSYVSEDREGVATTIMRAKLAGHDRLTEQQQLFRLQPATDSGRHFGSRIVFDEENHLYFSIGDRGDRPRAQNLYDPAGSIIRLNDDGSVPADNPFVGKANIRPEIFTYGHRNPQGMARDPQTGEIWSHEHGPQGGDELNWHQSGANYGWPVITYGVNYFIGTRIGEGGVKEGMEQPLYYWDPSIAPSGMAFYQGEPFAKWQGDLFIGSLKFKQLIQLKMHGKEVVEEKRYLTGQLGRIRNVHIGPDGLIYLLTDESNGALVRLSPKK